MINKIPNIKVPIIRNGVTETLSIKEQFKNKKIIMFGIPGAFTPTCSEEHFPGYIRLYDKIIKKELMKYIVYQLMINM